jgi:dCMP deaminase
MNRPSWDAYFMNLAGLVAERSTCLRRSVGAVLVKDKRIIATGYNGAPAGLPHCKEREGGCIRQAMNIPSGERHELCYAVHAEQNAIIQAAALGIPIEGATLYCTTQPCIICTKLLINAGVKRIVFSNPYPDELSIRLLNEAGVWWEVFDSGR